MTSGALGVVQLTRAETRAAETIVPAKETQPERAAQLAGGAGPVFRQVVAADTGKPVPSADVRIWIAFCDEWRKTDEAGRLEIAYSTGPANHTITLDVWGDGRAMQRHAWGYDPNEPIPDGATIPLHP